MDTRGSLVAIVLLASAGCAGSQVGEEYGTAFPQQEGARETADYRGQANSLRKMADRRQLEADLLAREVGPDSPGIEKKRRLAEELRTAAVEADVKAQDTARQVPEGMVIGKRSDE